MPKMSGIIMLYRPRQLVLAITHRGADPADFPKLIGESYARLGDHLQEHDVLMTDLPYVAYVNRESGEEGEGVELEIGIAVPHPVVGKGDIKLSAMPERTVASCMYRGPYEGLAELYAEIDATAHEWGFTASTGVSYEYYFNGPPFGPEDYLTRVVVPLEPLESPESPDQAATLNEGPED